MNLLCRPKTSCNSLKVASVGASWVAQWSEALHYSAWGVTADPGLIPGCVTSGREGESHRAAHNCPSVVWVRGGVCRGGLYQPSSESLWGAGRLQADFGLSVESCFLNTLLLSGRVLRSTLWWVLFWRTHDSTFAFSEPVGQLQQWHKIGEKRGVNIYIFIFKESCICKQFTCCKNILLF